MESGHVESGVKNEVRKLEASELKELLLKLTIKYKLSEEKRKSLSNKLSKLKENCRLHYDKLLNSERNRLLAEYNLFMSEKKIRKLENNIKKLTSMGKSERDMMESVERRTSSCASLGHVDEELTGLRNSLESNADQLINSFMTSGSSQTHHDYSDFKDSIRPVADGEGGVCPMSLADILASFTDDNARSFNVFPKQKQSRDSKNLSSEERVRTEVSSESVKSRQAQVDKLNSRLRVLKSVSAERCREIEEKKSALKEKEKMVSEVKDEIAKIREIIKLKSAAFN